MLTKFAAALLATSLIAGSAMAAQPSGTTGSNGSAPATQTQSPAATPKATTSVKHAVKHRQHVRKDVARGKTHVVHHARHARPAKTHQAGMNHLGKGKGTQRS